MKTNIRRLLPTFFLFSLITILSSNHIGAFKKVEPKNDFTTKQIIVENNVTEIIGSNSQSANNIELQTLVYDPLIHVSAEWIDLPEYPGYHGTKTWENYKAITNRASKQYQLQTFATTDEYGFRKLDGRYLVAVGTYFLAPSGTYIDIMLDNGTIIPAIVGDIKSDKHTDEKYNVYTMHSKCATEFICDASISQYCNGDVSYVFPDKWKSNVYSIRVYDYNYLIDGPTKK